MSVFALTLLAAACVSARQQEFSEFYHRNPTKDKSAMTKNLPNSDIEIDDQPQGIEKDMADFMEKLRKAVHSRPALDAEQRSVLEKSLKSFKRKSVDYVVPRVLSVEEVNMESGSAEKFFQEDIILSKEQQEEILSKMRPDRLKRQAYIDEYATDNGKWTTLVVPYVLDVSLSKRGKAAFRKAAKLWMRNTCINITERFYDDEEEEFKADDEEEEDEEEDDGEEEKQEEDDDYYEYNESEENGENDVFELPFLKETEFIKVIPGNYCASSVGKQEKSPFGSQPISLGRKCETIGSAAHELGHALGFWHMHVRHDREQYITVNWDNIDGDYMITKQFENQSKDSNDNYGLPYDYGSVMHYGATAGSANRTKPTLVPKDGLYTQTLGSLLLSFLDILMMNIHYNCTGFCGKAEHERCKNQGFAHPRNCSKCICPSGYGGDLCDERPTNCGEKLNVTSNWTKLITANSSDLESGNEDGYKRCVYWLEAPNGSKIEVRLTKLPENVSADGCIYAGVEIKTREDQRLTGYRFCSKDDVNTTLISNSSTVPVISYMRRRRNDTVTELEYRIAEENSRVGISETAET